MIFCFCKPEKFINFVKFSVVSKGKSLPRAAEHCRGIRLPVGNPDNFFLLQTRIGFRNFCNIFCCVDNDPKANLSFSSIHLDTAFACILHFKRGLLFQNAYSTSKSVDCLGELDMDTTNSRLSN